MSRALSLLERQTTEAGRTVKIMLLFDIIRSVDPHLVKIFYYHDLDERCQDWSRI